MDKLGFGMTTAEYEEAARDMRYMLTYLSVSHGYGQIPWNTKTSYSVYYESPNNMERCVFIGDWWQLDSFDYRSILDTILITFGIPYANF